MNLVRREPRATRRLGVLSGSFHPVTRAHLALAQAALDNVDEVLFILPRAFPHKSYDDVGLERRIEIVAAAVFGDPRFSVGTSDGGLFIEIARECRLAYPELEDIWFLCGKDAAERIAGWDYGRPDAFLKMLAEFGLLVAERDGRYEAPPEIAHRVRHLPLAGGWDKVSATEVRERIRKGETWEHLVPEAVIELVRRAYRED